MITLLTVGTTKSNVALTAIKSGGIFWQKNHMLRDLIFLVLFIFLIPRINNTENNTIQEYSILIKY